MRFTVIVGNPKPDSRTLSVATAAAAGLVSQFGLAEEYHLIDLSVLARRLLLPEPCAAIEDAVQRVTEADLLLVVSPTFKGTYSGLLKVFLDRLPYRGLAGAIALPILVMNSPQHALAVEVHLRPLLVELGASAPAPGLPLLEAELDQLDTVIERWTRRAAAALGAPVLTRQPVTAGQR